MFKVEMGVKGAYKVITKHYDTREEADARADRWRRSNSIGSYWATVNQVPDGQRTQNR